MPAGSSEPARPAPDCLLVIDAASGPCLAALVRGGTTIGEWRDAEQGAATARLPARAAALLEAANLPAEALLAVAVTVGPGSFTGLRASIAFAQGLAFAAGIRLVPVTLGEAIRAGTDTPGREIWVALDSRRGRIFLDRGGAIQAIQPEHPPLPTGPVAVAGDAAPVLAAALAGHDVTIAEARFATPAGIAAAARLRLAGALPPLDALPLYVDPPAAALPAGGLRPPPV